jgi:hypothetical protein
MIDAIVMIDENGDHVDASHRQHELGKYYHVILAGTSAGE